MKRIMLSAVFIVMLMSFGCNKPDSTEVVPLPTTNYENEVTKVEDLLDEPYIEIEVENYLRQEVPELKEYEKYISTKSDNKAFMIVECNDELHDVIYEGVEDQYYMVYVGERWEDHNANWDWFYVSSNLDKILWIDIVEFEPYSLSEWRESSEYSKVQKSLLDN